MDARMYMYARKFKAVCAFYTCLHTLPMNGKQDPISMEQLFLLCFLIQSNATYILSFKFFFFTLFFPSPPSLSLSLFISLFYTPLNRIIIFSPQRYVGTILQGLPTGDTIKRVRNECMVTNAGFFVTDNGPGKPIQKGRYIKALIQFHMFFIQRLLSPVMQIFFKPRYIEKKITFLSGQFRHKYFHVHNPYLATALNYHIGFSVSTNML